MPYVTSWTRTTLSCDVMNFSILPLKETLAFATRSFLLGPSATILSFTLTVSIATEQRLDQLIHYSGRDPSTTVSGFFSAKVIFKDYMSSSVKSFNPTVALLGVCRKLIPAKPLFPTHSALIIEFWQAWCPTLSDISASPVLNLSSAFSEKKNQRFLSLTYFAYLLKIYLQIWSIPRSFIYDCIQSKKLYGLKFLSLLVVPLPKEEVRQIACQEPPLVEPRISLMYFSVF